MVVIHASLRGISPKNVTLAFQTCKDPTEKVVKKLFFSIYSILISLDVNTVNTGTKLDQNPNPFWVDSDTTRSRLAFMYV